MTVIVYLEYFLNYFLPLFIFLLGWLGNIFGLKVLSNKALKKIGPKLVYQYLFIADSIYLLYSITIILQLVYHLDVTILSIIICKLLHYFGYQFSVLSPFLVVYISIDRYVSIEYSARRFFLRKSKTQHIFFWLVILILHLYYIPVVVFFEILSDTITFSNTTTFSLSCYLDSNVSTILVSYMDLAIRVILPFTMMSVLTGLLIKSVFKSRNRIVENFLAEQNKTFYKEIRLSFTSILVNLLYIITQLPASIAYYYPQYFSKNAYNATIYIFFLNYASNFYILLSTNSLFREKFFKLFKK